MPTARSNALCPYCDHLSPAGSKFCNDCGAALHLRPCPHCGSVNDVTLNTHCSRCNGDLGFAEPAGVVAEAAMSPPPAPDPGSAAPFAQQAKTPRAPLIGAALLALAGVAYIGLATGPEPNQSSAPAMARPAPAAIEKPDKPAMPRPAASPSAQVLSAPEPVASAPGPAQPPQAAAAVPAFAASLARLSPPGAGRSAHRREAAIAPAGAAASPVAERFNSATRKPGDGLDLKQPNIGSCTDAVAALGLCAAEPNPRRP
jgi:hypothetical protein